MEVFSLIWDFLFGTFIRINHYLETWYQNAAESGFVISKGSLIMTTLLVILLCGSAMVAMTIAEIKFRNRLLHGGLGFICPVIYPVLLYFVIPSGVAKTAEKNKEPEKAKIKVEDALPESELKAFSKKHNDQEDSLPAGEALDQAYFTLIAKDETGNLRGPFILELDDDQILEIECIIDALAPAVAVQIGKDDKARTIRLPYSKIKSCMTKSDWLAEADDPDDDEYEDEPVYEEEPLTEEEE